MAKNSKKQAKSIASPTDQTAFLLAGLLTRIPDLCRNLGPLQAFWLMTTLYGIYSVNGARSDTSAVAIVALLVVVQCLALLARMKRIK
jgi:hypothetical protein